MHQSNVIQNKICTQRRHRNIFSELSQISVVHQSEVISFMIMHHRKSLKMASIVGILKQRKKYICEPIRKKECNILQTVVRNPKINVSKYEIYISMFRMVKK